MRHSSSYDQQTLSAFLRAMSRGNVINGWAVSLKHQFQEDYRLIRSRTETDKCYHAKFPKLNLYILRHDELLEIPGHDRGECVVIEDREAGSHVVLHGEINKASLDFLGGICGFLTPEGDPVAEVKRLFELWDQEMALIEKDFPRDTKYYKLLDHVKTFFVEVPFKSSAEKFLVPIESLRISPVRLARFAALAPTPQSPSPGEDGRLIPPAP